MYDPKMFEAWWKNTLMMYDAQYVIGMRTMQMMAGGPKGKREASSMVVEKLAAFTAAQIAMTTALATGKSLKVAQARAMTPITRKLRANRRRLSKG
jgi:hypothetical protein